MNVNTENLEVAQKAMGVARDIDPNFRLHKVKDRLPYTQPEMLTRWEEALRKAGLPE